MHDLGFVTAILPDHPLEDIIKFASKNGYKCLEVMCWPVGKAERRYAGVTHIDVNKLDQPNLDSIQQTLEEYEVYISGLGYYPNPLEADDSRTSVYFEHLKKVIKAAEKLKIPVVNTFIGRDPAKNVSDNLAKFKEKWPPIVAYAGDHGIKIGIENCPMLFTDDEWPGGKNLAVSPAIWDELFSIISDAHFGLNYDPSHLVWQFMDEIQPIYDYRDRLHHIHLKDVKIYPEKLDRVGILATPLQYHQPKIPGLGDVRWPDFFSALTSVGYRGPVCVEVEDRAFESSQEDVYNSLKQSRNYLQQFLA